MTTVLLAALSAIIALDLAAGYALRWFYRRWDPTGSEGSFPKRLREHLRSEMGRHYLFCDHANLVQEDGGYRKTTTFDPYVGWRWPVERRIYLEPGRAMKPLLPPGAGLFTDRFGVIPNHREAPVDLENKLPSQFRVFMLGGSSLAGAASLRNKTGECIGNDGTITARAETLLNDGPGDVKFQVINLSVHAYRSNNELISYASEFSHYPHDMVIAFHGYNDAVLARLDATSRVWSGASYSPANVLNLISWNEEVMSKVRHQESASLLGLALRLVPQVLSGSSLAILARFAISLLTSGQHGGADSSASLGEDEVQRIEVYAERLTANDLRLAAIAVAEGKSFVSILQPILATKRRPTEEERKFLPEPSQEAHYRRFMAAAREAYSKRAADFERLGARFLDWSSILDDSPERLYSDIIHYSDAGIEIIAGKLAKVIRGREAGR